MGHIFFIIFDSHRTAPSPIYGLHDVTDNRVVTVSFRDPKYDDGFIFEAKRLPGAVDPPNVLAPENRASGYRPQIGFKRDFPQASLGEAGHRFVNHHAGGGYQQRQQQPYQQQNRNYASIAPPNNYRNGKLRCRFATKIVEGQSGDRKNVTVEMFVSSET